MEYISFETLCGDIRSNFWKIPKDVFGVIGIPRSGMLPATIISEFLNVGLASSNDLDRDCDLYELFSANHGNRYMKTDSGKKILVVDDTCFSGTQNLKIRNKIENLFGDRKDFEFIYVVVYMEGNGETSMPDIYLRDIRWMARSSENGIVLYEWNLFNHNPRTANRIMFDYDGVFCLDPPDERNTEEYERYIKDPVPLFLPTNNPAVTINVVTYRLEKYRKETEEFLRKNGIRNLNIRMYPSFSYEERSKTKPEIYKGNYYKNSEAILFVESDDMQARMIRAISGKSVYCVKTNKIYK